MGKLSALIVFSLLLIVNGCSSDQGESTKPVPFYTLLLSTEEDPENGQALAAEAADLDGEVVVFVNENPVSLFSSSGQMLPLGQWIRNGKNTISMKGKHGGDLFFKVLESEGPPHIAKELEVLGKFKKPATETEKELKIDLELGVDYEIPLFQEGNEISKSPGDVKKEALLLVEKLNEHWMKKEIEAAISVSTEGQAIYEKLRFGRTDEELLAQKGRWMKFWEDENRAVLGIDLQRINLVIGKQVVMVYNMDEEQNQAISFRFKDGDRKFSLGPIFLANLSGRWVIW